MEGPHNRRQEFEICRVPQAFWYGGHTAVRVLAFAATQPRPVGSDEPSWITSVSVSERPCTAFELGPIPSAVVCSRNGCSGLASRGSCSFTSSCSSRNPRGRAAEGGSPRPPLDERPGTSLTK